MKNNIDQIINEVLTAPASFNDVKISPQFKEKVIHKLFNEKKDATVVSWFTPKLQVAAAVIVLLVNSIAITYIVKTNYSTNILNFSKTFNINNSESVLN